MKLLIDEDTLNVVVDALNIGYLIAKVPEDVKRFNYARNRLLKEMSEAKKNFRDHDVRSYDPSEFLTSEEAISEYLKEAKRSGAPDLIAHAETVAGVARANLRLKDNRNKITGTN